LEDGVSGGAGVGAGAFIGAGDTALDGEVGLVVPPEAEGSDAEDGEGEGQEGVAALVLHGGGDVSGWDAKGIIVRVHVCLGGGQVEKMWG